MSVMTYVNCYFDQLVEPMFQRDEQGREIYFPMGMGTRGRLVPDAATGQQLRQRMRQGWFAFFFGWIPLIGASATFIANTWAFAGVMLVSLALVWGFALSTARGLAISSRRMTIANQSRSVLTSYSLKRLVWMALLSAALAAVCILNLTIPAIAVGQPSWFMPMTILGIAFFAGTTIMWIWYAILKWRRG